MKLNIVTISYLLFQSIAFAQSLQIELVSPNQASTDHEAKRLDKIIAKSRLLSLHRALVEVESISGNELDVGHLVVSTLKAHDFTVTTQLVPDVNNASAHRWNIYAVPNVKRKGKSKKSSPKVILSSHIDTVPPFIKYSLSQPEHSNARSDVLISGRGTVDDKACVAAQIEASIRLLESGRLKTPSDLALLFVVSEETNGSGMKFFSESKLYNSIKNDVQAVIFGEPTEGKLASGHKGITMVHLVAKGKAAHSGYPWLGKSANSMIIPALMVLDKLGNLLPEEGGLPRSEEYGNSTVNVGFMSGGVAANVIPAHAEAKIAFRLAGGTPESVTKIIQNALHGADPKGELDVDIFQGYGPVPLDTDVEGFETLVVNYGTDVPNLAVESHVKRYLYGPGSILVAHGENESLTIGEMEKAVDDYDKLIEHVLSL